MFAFRWFFYTDFPVEEGQLKNDIAFGTFTPIKHSKTSGGTSLPCLPFAIVNHKVLGILVFKHHLPQLYIYIRYV